MKTKLYWTAALVLIIGIALLARSADNNSLQEKILLAKCLTEKGVKMFGAFWCPHCKTQKELFGSAFDYINYIECSLPSGEQNQFCEAQKIEGYPTWEFSDGLRIEGEASFQTLKLRSGC